MFTKIGNYITLVFHFSGFYLNDSFSKKNLKIFESWIVSQGVKNTIACFYFEYNFENIHGYFESNGVPKY